MNKQCDFAGWATRNDLLCGDGRTIRKNAFVDDNGKTVPLVWNHDHSNLDAVLGHAILENREDGVYAYCYLNETDEGIRAKSLVQHGDVKSLSIYANGLKHKGSDVIHGCIRELSLVLAGANPGAYVDFVMAHSADEVDAVEASWDENIVIYHSAEKADESKEESKMGGEGKTIREVLETLNDEQKSAVGELLGMLEHSDIQDDAEETENTEEAEEAEEIEEVEEADETLEHSEDQEEENGGNNMLKHNLFENDCAQTNGVTLTHSDEQAILRLAKQSSVGSLKQAIAIYEEENELQHGAIDGEVLGALFPEYKDVYPGQPETLKDDQSWIAGVINGVHKSPVSRVRTRQLDVRNRRNRAKGYKKGTYKEEGTDVELLQRTTDPQTIFIKDRLNRDDIIDFTDFDIVNYQWTIMREALNEEIATAILIGDARLAGDPDKIYETHVRSILNDEDLYTIKKTVNISAFEDSVQGTDGEKYFGPNFIWSEAMIEAILDARIDYKGSGNLTFYCTPRFVNKMLLARDRDGHRMYKTVEDLRQALNVAKIQTVEQFEDLTRTSGSGTDSGTTYDVWGILVDLRDYQIGSTKGGEITKFEQFDIDFNQQKLLLETRISGALTRIKSAIVLQTVHTS